MEIECRLNRILLLLFNRRFIVRDMEAPSAQDWADMLIIMGNNLEFEEVEELFEILAEDKYVKLNEGHESKIANAIHSTITLKGTLFILSGGYVAQMERMASEQEALASAVAAQNMRADKLEKELSVNRSNMERLTFWMTIATIALAIEPVVKFLQWLSGAFCCGR